LWKGRGMRERIMDKVGVFEVAMEFWIYASRVVEV